MGSLCWSQQSGTIGVVIIQDSKTASKVVMPKEKRMPVITFTARAPPQGGSLSIRVISCADLPDMDGLGLANQSDPYVKVICANKIMKTEVVDDEPEHPKFEEATSTFTFPVVNPAGAEEVCFEVWDKDTLSPDDFIGRASPPDPRVAHGCRRWSAPHTAPCQACQEQ